VAQKETMTSRERMKMALNHQEPDRIPIDLGGNQTGIHRQAYCDLIKHLGIKDDKVEIMDCVQQLVRPSEELLQRFNVDTRYVATGCAGDFKFEIIKNQRDGRLWHDFTDEFGITWSMPDDQQLYMDISHHPLADAEIDEINDYPFPDGGDAGRFAGLRERALEIKNNTPYSVVSGISGVVYETCWYMRGLENWMIDMVAQPEFCEALIDRTMKYWLDYFKVFCKEVGDVVDVIMIGDDLAGQSGPLFNPEFYRRVVKPRQQLVARYIRDNSDAALWYHTCGNCTEYIPDLIENGVNILNPVQLSADNMDAAVLKSKFGKDIVFWGGGCDSQHILPFSSPKQVCENVRANVEALKPGGGYVFNNIHNIQAFVPPVNIEAMYEAAYDYGWYC